MATTASDYLVQRLSDWGRAGWGGTQQAGDDSLRLAATLDGIQLLSPSPSPSHQGRGDLVASLMGGVLVAP